jgi:hypothetical protein
MEDKTIKWNYSILVDDHEKDPDYTEWTRLYWDILVFKSYKEINKRLREIFDESLWPIEYIHENCNIKVLWSVDRESPWKPLCFCNIIVEWILENVKKIDKILNNEFPWIWEYLKK